MFGTRTPAICLIVGLAAIAVAASPETVDEPTTVKYVPEPPVTSAKPTKPPVTTTPATTSSSTTLSTTTSTSTTESPKTTTTAAPTTSTTAAPITTPTTAAPITTPTTAAPTPKPTPMEENTWEVDSSNKTACLLIHMMAAVDVYHKVNNVTDIEQIVIPKEAVATGNCGELVQNISLSWKGFHATINNTVGLVFKKNGTNFDLETVMVNVTVMDKNTTTWLNNTRTKKEFETPISMSYKCKKNQMLNFTDTSTNETVASLLISNVQFQAFSNITDKKFASAKDCEPYETPDIVPIAVGCALIALIVFVLVGYLIGRRRNQTRGYLSM